MSMLLEKHDYIGFSEGPSMEKKNNFEKKMKKKKNSISLGDDDEIERKNNKGLNFKATELRLGLPGSESPEREFEDNCVPPAAKAQVVGWPPIRSFRKNSMATNPQKIDEDDDSKLGISCLYVKVSMDGAPYLRKIDLKIYTSYKDLSSALEKMFSCFRIGQCGSHGVHICDGLSESHLMDLLHGSEYVLTYEDKDADWMLVGDVPWEMFTGSCKRLRIMKSSDAIGLAPRAIEKCKSRT